MRSACLVAAFHMSIFSSHLRSSRTQGCVPSSDKGPGLGIQPEYISQAYGARCL